MVRVFFSHPYKLADIKRCYAGKNVWVLQDRDGFWVTGSFDDMRALCALGAVVKAHFGSARAGAR